MITLIFVWLALLSLTTGFLLFYFLKTFIALTTIVQVGEQTKDVIDKLPKELKEQFPTDWRRNTGSAAKKGYH